MGYDGGIIIVKKKVVEKVKHLLVAYSFSELYENYLYMWEYPKIYNFPKDEGSIGIDVLDENVFDEYFRRKPLENGESRIIPKSIYIINEKKSCFFQNFKFFSESPCIFASENRM